MVPNRSDCHWHHPGRCVTGSLGGLGNKDGLGPFVVFRFPDETNPPMHAAFARRHPDLRNGSTWVGVPGVLILVAASLSYGVPRWIDYRERGRVAEAFAYFDCVAEAQREQVAKSGFPAQRFDTLDLRLPAPVHFVVSDYRVGEGDHRGPTWSMTLRRTGPAHSHGNYRLTFGRDGWDCAASDVRTNLIELAGRYR